MLVGARLFGVSSRASEGDLEGGSSECYGVCTKVEQTHCPDTKGTDASHA